MMLVIVDGKTGGTSEGFSESRLVLIARRVLFQSRMNRFDLVDDSAAAMSKVVRIGIWSESKHSRTVQDVSRVLISFEVIVTSIAESVGSASGWNTMWVGEPSLATFK